MSWLDSVQSDLTNRILTDPGTLGREAASWADYRIVDTVAPAPLSPNTASALASGAELDRIAESAYGLERSEGETDAALRTRVAHVHAGPPPYRWDYDPRLLEITIAGLQVPSSMLGIKPKTPKPEPRKYKPKSIYEWIREGSFADYSTEEE
jgi:hypothetical protein